MDIKDYIQSGVIESYVLGLADEQEIVEIEQLKQQHPEVQQAIDEFSLTLEEQAFKNAIAPPADVKARLISDLDLNEIKANQGDSPLVVAFNSSKKSDNGSSSKLQTWRYLAAASIILFVVSASANLFLYSKYNNTKDQYQALLTEQGTLQANNNIYQTKVQEYQQAAEMMADPSFTKVQLKDPKGAAPNMTTVFWNKDTKNVYLMTNKLPTPAKDKQYQLWALVDGKPVDAGMLDVDCAGLCKMKNIPKAQAFAITLEKTGGNPQPTMTQLYVIGNV